MRREAAALPSALSPPPVSAPAPPASARPTDGPTDASRCLQHPGQRRKQHEEPERTGERNADGKGSAALELPPPHPGMTHQQRYTTTDATATTNSTSARVAFISALGAQRGTNSCARRRPQASTACTAPSFATAMSCASRNCAVVNFRNDRSDVINCRRHPRRQPRHGPRHFGLIATVRDEHAILLTGRRPWGRPSSALAIDRGTCRTRSTACTRALLRSATSTRPRSSIAIPCGRSNSPGPVPLVTRRSLVECPVGREMQHPRLPQPSLTTNDPSSATATSVGWPECRASASPAPALHRGPATAVRRRELERPGAVQRR